MRLWLVAASLLALLPGACRQAPQRVDPADHQAFYLWAGVEPGQRLSHASRVYVLDGEVPLRGGRDFVPLRGAAPRFSGGELVLVVRTGRLDWDEAIWRRVLADLDRWSQLGNHLVGLQIDFDAATRGLAGYADFLAKARQRLPARYSLSITGLMDWSVHADPADLARLKGTVDEVVVQTYQGRTTIPGYANYLEKLARLPIPHRVAVVEGGEWREPAALRHDPLYRGTVVFLLNPR